VKAVAEYADDRIVDRVPNDAGQRAEGSEARFESHHIGEIDGIKNGPHHPHAGDAPIPGAIEKFCPKGKSSF
jgi:hypothetical protein